MDEGACFIAPFCLSFDGSSFVVGVGVGMLIILIVVFVGNFGEEGD